MLDHVWLEQSLGECGKVSAVPTYYINIDKLENSLFWPPKLAGACRRLQWPRQCGVLVSYNIPYTFPIANT